MKRVDTACWVATQDPSERQTFTQFYSLHVTRTWFNQSFKPRTATPFHNTPALSGCEPDWIFLHQVSPFAFEAKVTSNLRHTVWGGKVTFRSLRTLQARRLIGRLVLCWNNWRNDEVPAKHAEIQLLSLIRRR